MDKTAKIRMKAKRNVTDLAGEKVMVDFEQGKYFCIKGVGNDIWDMLDGQVPERCPASILTTHRDAVLSLDRESANYVL